MKTEFQRQLEALGFVAIKQSKAECSGSRVKPNVIINNNLTEVEAKVIIKKYYSNPKNWQLPIFGSAFRTLTGQNMILSPEKAMEVVSHRNLFESKFYDNEYSVAVLVLSGIWIPPKLKANDGMSKEIKARNGRRTTALY